MTASLAGVLLLDLAHSESALLVGDRNRLSSGAVV
jgi:hypothetical protein